MHTHYLCDHPKIFALTDGWQTQGQFYLHGPVNFQEVSSSPAPLHDTDQHVRPQPGHAEIVFSMERLKALAEEEGQPTDVLTLEGPSAQNHGQYDDLSNAWAAGETAQGMTLDRIQVLRTHLREFWTQQLLCEHVNQLQGMDVAPDQEGSFLSLLGQFQDQLQAWRQAHTSD